MTSRMFVGLSLCFKRIQSLAIPSNLVSVVKEISTSIGLKNLMAPLMNGGGLGWRTRTWKPLARRVGSYWLRP